MTTNLKNTARTKRHRKIRKRLRGTTQIPRLVVFRSLRTNYVQLIDDDKNITLMGTSDIKIKKGTPLEKAKQVGLNIAKMALEKKITQVVFDRAGYQYHGRVQALAEGAREGGLKF